MQTLEEADTGTVTDTDTDTCVADKEVLYRLTSPTSGFVATLLLPPFPFARLVSGLWAVVGRNEPTMSDEEAEPFSCFDQS